MLSCCDVLMLNCCDVGLRQSRRASRPASGKQKQAPAKVMKEKQKKKGLRLLAWLQCSSNACTVICVQLPALSSGTTTA